jgi:hypothetical protein
MQQKATMPHLHLALLAYRLVNTIRYQLKQKGVNSSWKEIVRIANTQRVFATSGQNQQGITIQYENAPRQTKAWQSFTPFYKLINDLSQIANL